MASEPAPAGRGRAAWGRRGLLAATGAAGALAFPPTDWWLLGWLWPVPLLAAAAGAAPGRALLDGWAAGFGFFVVLLRWLDHTFTHYSAIPWPLSWLPIGLLAAYCGLYVGLAAGSVAWVGRAAGPAPGLAVAAPAWVAGEWLRGWLLGGFPWGLQGYSQHAVLPVIQVAELTGVWGVSFLLLLAASALAAALRLGWRAWPHGAAACLLVGAAAAGGQQALGGLDGGGPEPVRVGVIQPNIEQRLKWDPEHAARVQARYEALTRAAARDRPALVLWPETAAPIMLRADRMLERRLAGLAGELGTALLVGSIDRADDGRAPGYLNSAFLVTGEGIRGRYDKIQLVPFGEYVPLGGLLGFVRGWAEFISELRAGERPTVFALPGTPFGTVICYEVVFPDLFRRFVRDGAVVMANITNDAWFGETSGPWQHLGVLALRAVENRVAIARSANTGVSALVAPSGRVETLLGLGQAGVLTGTLARRPRTTLYTRLGDWFALVCAALTAGALGIARARRSGRTSGRCSAS